MNRIIFTSAIALLLFSAGSAQNTLTLEEAIKVAMENNMGLAAAQKATDRQIILKDAQKVIDKTNFFYGYDHNNIAENGRALHVFGASQSLKMPGYYEALDQLGDAKTTLQSSQYQLEIKELSRQVAFFFNDYKYWRSIREEQVYMDSLYQQLEERMDRRLVLGEGTTLEKVSAIAKRRTADIQIRKAEQKMMSAQSFLQSLLQIKEFVQPDSEGLQMMELVQPDIETHPQYLLWQNRQQIAQAEANLADQEAKPEWNVNVFGGFNDFTDFRLYPGVEVGISMALWKGAYQKKKAAAQMDSEINILQANNAKRKLESQLISHSSNLQVVKDEIDTYNDSGITLEKEIERSANQAFKSGEISFLEYVTAMESASELRQNFLQNLFQYNQYIIAINYLLNP